MTINTSTWTMYVWLRDPVSAAYFAAFGWFDPYTVGDGCLSHTVNA